MESIFYNKYFVYSLVIMKNRYIFLLWIFILETKKVRLEAAIAKRNLEFLNNRLTHPIQFKVQFSR